MLRIKGTCLASEVALDVEEHKEISSSNTDDELEIKTLISSIGKQYLAVLKKESTDCFIQIFAPETAPTISPKIFFILCS